ncbi:type II secretion system F family protein [Aliidiomarina sanyensis]|uniref:Type II secretion system protein GspF domain-containing protein n=1 Tax=Aliidiomarina sanyensis TaxID=1249555 RepID=A0A432WEV1_9GAMM|nr:type II secretion system F family protein [Aliidiomarina sanyensis]RUO31338.1 hypothetical protein CWE11_08305 [Aliidiomarina sanyensis]
MFTDTQMAKHISTLFFTLAFTLWSVGIGLILRTGYRAYVSDYALRLQRKLSDVWLFIPLRSLIQVWLLGCALVLLLGFLSQRSGLILLVLLALWVVAPWIAISWFKRRRLELFLGQLPDAFMLLANSIATGSTMQRSLHFVSQNMPAPLGQEFAVVVRQLKLGLALESAFKPMESRMNSVDVRRMIMTLLLATQTGSQQAKMLYTCAQTLRKKRFLHRKIQTISAQGRLQGKVMSALPFVLFLAFFWIEPEVMKQLAHHPFGWMTGGMVVVLIVIGHGWIQRMLRIPVPL